MSLCSLSRSLVRVLLVAALTGPAAAAWAQTDPVPIVPLEEETADPTTPIDPDDPAADTTTVTSTARTTRWDYSLGLGAGWESNVGLQPTTQGPSDYLGSAFGTLSRTAIRPRGQTRFSVAGSTYVYAEQQDYDRWDGSGSFGGSWSLSQRTTGALGLGVHYGHTDNSRILSDQGLVLPLTRAIDYSGDLGLSHRLSTRTDFRLSARAYRVDFPESELLRDTTSLRLTAGLDRQVGRYDTLSAEYATERVEPVESTPESVPYWTHYASGIWSRVLGRRSALRVEGGASHTPVLDTEGGQSWRFYGGLSLSRTVDQSTLTAFYRREVLPAFGIGGLRFTDRFGLDAGIPLGRVFQLGLGGAYTRDAEANADGARLSTLDANASLSARLARRLSLSAEGRYYRRWPFGEFPDLDNYRVGLFLVFGSGTGRPATY